MKLSIRVANPAGNITIFVMNEVPKKDYTSIASQLLKLEKYHAEQVAFNVSPIMGGMGRIEMMGGEFCGNATRSYGYLISQMQDTKPENVLVEISGALNPLNVEINHKKGTCKTQMPLLQKVETINYKNNTYSAMVFDGIVHIIVPDSPKNQSFINDILNTAKNKILSDAYGVMFLEDSKLTPVVYVVNTDSIIWESSCGSGSMACAAFLSQNKSDGIYTYSFNQPGGTIEAEIQIKNNQTVSCKMGGKVTLSDEIEIEL